MTEVNLKAPLASPTFTGTATSASFAGPLNGTVGATTPATGSFTTLAASSTVSGTGFSTYLASPPAIGGTAPAAGSFTNLAANGTVTFNAASASIIAGTNATSGALQNDNNSASFLAFGSTNANASKLQFTANSTVVGVWNSTVLAITGGLTTTTSIAATTTVSGASLIPTGSTVPTNGLFLPVANSVGISTNSTERVRVDASGNVVITGTAATGGLNSYSGTTTNYNRIYMTNTSGGMQLGVESSTGGSVVTGAAAYSTFMGASANQPLYLITNNLIRTTIDTSGNLTQTGNISGAAIIPTGSTVPTVGTFLPATNNIAWATASTKRLEILANGTIQDGAGLEIGWKTVPQNSQSANYTLVASDSGKHIYHPSADTTARTFTIPANASVAYPVGTSISFVNDTSAGVISIAINTDTLTLAGAGTTGTRSLAANGVATAIKVTSTKWFISGSGLT